MLVSREFAENFDLAVRHYGFTPKEINEAKAAAKADMEAAEECFAAIAQRIAKVETNSNERTKR
jgi:hypothetical protein